MGSYGTKQLWDSSQTRIPALNRYMRSSIINWEPHTLQKKKDLKTAIKHYTIAAKKDHPLAQYKLGLHYEKGEGVEIDLKKAEEYFKSSADGGNNINAQFHLGQFYDEKGKTPDIKQAFSYYMKAADQELCTAQYHVGLFYEHGKVGEKEPKKAFQYYEHSSNQGYAPAIYKMGLCYLKGVGVDKKDEGKGKALIKDAAQRGDLLAKKKLKKLK